MKLGRERNGLLSRSGERLRESGEHRQIGMQRDPLRKVVRAKARKNGAVV